MIKASTSGSWKNLSNNLPRLTGMNTKQINWGVPANRARRQSGYRYIGRKVPLHVDGKEFVLGTFTHNNFPVRGMGRNNRFSIKLRINVAFDKGGLNRNFNFNFNHFETPNKGNRKQQADRVALSSVISSETVKIDGENYAVEIVGFKQGGKIVNEFISYENAANSAVIVAKLAHIPKPKLKPKPQSMPKPQPESEPEESTTYTFSVLNPDGSVFGKGCFTYEGDEVPIDLTHIVGGNGGGSELTSFYYHDPLVGEMDINQIVSMKFINGVEGKPSKFTINAANVPDDTQALSGGIATPEQAGGVSVHRYLNENSSCSGRKITFPIPCHKEVSTGAEEETTVPKIDLAVVIDTSVSMRPEAISLSDSIDKAIKSAKSKCPSDLKVTYLGVEGRFSESLFDTTIRQHLTGIGVAESEMRGRKRGTVEGGGAQEDGARAIQDVSIHHNWRDDTERAIFYLSDEGLEGGDTIENDDIEETTRAIDVAVTNEVRVHTYFAETKAKAKIREANESEFKQLASSTGGRYFNAQSLQGGGFQKMLEEVICASKAPLGVAETIPCGCTMEDVEASLK